MKILISNDDGIKANGIHFLNNELSKSFDVTMIAPDKERSSCGHGITLGEPVRVNKVSEKKYECSGFPADCVLVGIGHFFKDQKPDVVVSGINHGANLGQDRYYSGTIAAAREAAFRGVKSIAVSLVTKSIKDMEHFEVAAQFVHFFISKNLHLHIPEMCVLNINVPNISREKIAGVKMTHPGFQEYTEEVIERIDTRGRQYYWLGGTYQGSKDIPGSDCNAVNENYISLNIQDLSGKTVEIDKLKEVIKELEDF